MKLYRILENILKNDPDLITEKGEIKKRVLISKAKNFDENLLKLLLGEHELKEKFFKNIQGVFVFNQPLFTRFLEQKKDNLMGNDAGGKNKIGLTVNGMFLTQNDEVVLTWPLKNSVLESGQSKQERKRKEIIFHETLDRKEINRLFEPKVLTNTKRFTENGMQLLYRFNRNSEINKKRGLPEYTITDNLIIKGNNLPALHSLEKVFAGKIKLIYIDPPYNTGNDGFHYNDRFKRSSWLTFMKNRLDVAKKLLKEDGAVFIQCDDNEQAYLKIMMDEVFGEDNYRETIVVKTSTPSGVNAINVKRGERLFKVKEYLLFYSKNPTYRFKPVYVKSRFNTHYRYEVIPTENGYAVSDLRKRFENPEDFISYALENYRYIYSLEKNNKKAGEKIKKVIRESRSTNEVTEFINSKNQKVLVYHGGVLIPLKNRIVKTGNKNHFGTLISDLWDDEVFQSNKAEGGVSLPGGKKPEKLLQRVLELTTNEYDIVLDYYLGSGTTAAVAHKMNRRYIGIEQLDYGDNDSVIRLQKVIQGEKTGISVAVDWQGGGEFVYSELKKYNPVFMSMIRKAKSTQELIKIWKQIKKHSFLEYQMDVKTQEENRNNFQQLGFEEQKLQLISFLNKNQLYVNVSSMDDEDLPVSEKEKQITHDFYKC